MRILFVINSFSYGGAEKLVFDLAQALNSKCESISIAALYRMESDTEMRMQSSLEQKGVKTYILGKKAGADRVSAVRKLCKIVKADNIQLIHAHCSVPMYLSKLTGFVTRVKVVCTVHNTRGYRALLEKMTGWMVHGYVSIGQAAEEYMLDSLGIKKNKVTRIYNAVDTDKFQPGERSGGFWEQWGFDETVPVVLNVGRVVTQKNQLCLLRAVAQCCEKGSQIQCAILGGFDTSSETYKELQAFIQSNALENNIRFLGQQDDVPMFLQNSDCFVMTSWYEGLSVSYLEAVLCGTPIVITDMPFVRELEQFGTTAVIVPQDDAEALADVLMNCRYARPAEETIECYSEKFSMSKFAESHFALYSDVLGIDVSKHR